MKSSQLITSLRLTSRYFIVRGTTSRLSVLNVGKKLKENATHNNGKVILIFPENVILSGDDLFRIRSDIIINEPISTLRLVLYLISLSGQDMETVKEKLMKYAVTDSQFRNNEQQILKNAGITVDSEIEFLSNTETLPLINDKMRSSVAYIPDQKSDDEQPNMMVFRDDSKDSGPSVQIFKKETADEVKNSKHVPSATAADFEVTSEIQERINEEIRLTKSELPLRIESYNRAIKGVDQDLKKGHKKRQTRKEFNQLHKDLLNEKKTDKNAEKDLDNERIQFTKALFSKK